MDPALVTLAGVAGTSLVQAMTTDTWETVKTRFAAILGHHDEHDRSGLTRELEVSALHLRSPSGPLEAAMDEERRRWAVLLAAYLREHGDAAPELREFALTAGNSSRDSFTIVQRVSAGRDTYTAGRDQHVTPPPATDPESRRGEGGDDGA